MPQPIQSSYRPLAALLLAALLCPRPIPASSPTAQTQSLYQAAAPAAPPTQVLWNNGAAWSWDGARLDQQAYLGAGGLTLDGEQPSSKVKDGALHLGAEAACPRGCDVEVLRLVLPAPVDPGAYLKSGHLQLEVERVQPMLGALVFSYGDAESGSSASVRLDSLPQGRYRHLFLPLSGFKPPRPAGARMSVPFQLSVKGAHYPAGPLLALKFIRWTPD